jgi:hypothetical protein
MVLTNHAATTAKRKHRDILPLYVFFVWVTLGDYDGRALDKNIYTRSEPRHTISAKNLSTSCIGCGAKGTVGQIFRNPFKCLTLRNEEA